MPWHAAAGECGGPGGAAVAPGWWKHTFGNFQVWGWKKRGKKGEEGNADAGLGKNNSSIKQTLSGKHDAISISARVVKYLIRGSANKDAFRNKWPCFTSQASSSALASVPAERLPPV